MKHIDYLDYSYQDLLKDQFFLDSHLYPTDESVSFWNELKETNEHFAGEVSLAENVLRSLPFRNNTLNARDENELLKCIQQTIRLDSRKKNRRRFLYTASAAASIALLFLFSWMYFVQLVPDSLVTGKLYLIERPVHPYNEIKLIDIYNNEYSVTGNESAISNNSNGELSINSITIKRTVSANKSKYNKIIVPPGKRLLLTLSDGSKVWVNANSRVTYPDQFNEDMREIQLEGEAFLEVTPNTQKPFYVRTMELDVRVLGTSFNVSAFKNEKETSVVLVTGKVSVSTNTNMEQILSPNEKLSFEEGKINTQAVNVNNHISWINGVYSFDYEKFSVVLNKLSRYYGKKIAWSPEVEELYCSGSLNLKEDIYRILEGLKMTVPVTFTEKQQTIEVNVKP